MSDIATDVADTEIVEPAEPAAPEPKPEPKPKDWESEAAKWKALARKHEDASKANADKAKQFDEITEAQKSELDKALERAAQAEAKAAEVEQRATRAEVASDKGVPVHLVTGSTREEMEASADAALAWRGSIPAPDFGGGRRGSDSGGVSQMSQNELDRLFAAGNHDAIVAARKEGRLNTLMATKK